MRTGLEHPAERLRCSAGVGVPGPTGSTCVAFLQRERSSRLDIRLDRPYSVHVIFVVAAILRCAWNFCRGPRRGPGARSGAGAAAP